MNKERSTMTQRVYHFYCHTAKNSVKTTGNYFKK